MAVGLATIPLDTQLEILGWIPDFPSLHSCLLLNCRFSQLFADHRPSLTKSVAHNYFGDLLEDALILANTQSKRRYSGPNTRDYRSSFIKKLLSNEGVLEKVISIVFRFLTHNNARMSEWSDEDRIPTPTELFRFKRAAYRFWTFSTVQESKRSWFLSKLPAIELSEIGHFYYGVEAWVSQMYTLEELEFESDHDADRFSSVLSTGLGRISWLWELFVDMLEDQAAWEMFGESMGVAMDGREEGFFKYDFHDHWTYDEIDIGKIKPILDEGHERMEAKLRKAKRARKATKEE
ncbi:hypothetical protein B0H17DRAFT_1340878 [Mycena rosella]|uniref:F-box domain-containing protein n=1 Tax=Mycena rosella TaxID=1033263 RepID=A0AAD7BEZ9_MYCRO|nr:hypothetical protein B0H17DRAFT_1340878 [Mycena rosella]